MFDATQTGVRTVAQKAFSRRVEIFRQRIFAAALTSPVATIFLAATQAGVAGWQRSLAWFILINCSELFIIWLTYPYQAGAIRKTNEAVFLKRMMIAEALAGLGWGTSVWFFWTAGQPGFYYLNLVVLVGVLGICIVVLSPFLKSMALFSGGVLLVPVIHLFMISDISNLPVLLGAILLYVLTLQYTKLAEKDLVSGLENAERLEELSAELIARTNSLTELSAHVEQSKEQERLRISREIHDEMGGNLAAMKMNLYLIENGLQPDQTALIEKIHYLETLIDRTIEAGYRIARGLRPGILDLGIVPALEWLVNEFNKQNLMDCQFSANCTDVVLSSEHATALFRMAQEGLVNAAKHSKADRVSVAFLSHDAGIMMKIIDNGQGFDARRAAKTNAFGLIGMAERCKEIGASIVVESGKGEGCAITIEIPAV